MALRITEDEWVVLQVLTGAAPSAAKQPVTPKPNKYRAQKKTVGGIVFASSAEARRYSILRAQAELGQISDLSLQETYPIEINGIHICTYIADFVYTRDGLLVVEDVKGVRTPVYELKAKLMRAVHGIEISEVSMRK